MPRYVLQVHMGLNRLTGLGVDGFRIDAAKHVPAEDRRAIYDGLDGEAKIFQEVIEGGPDEYSGPGCPPPRTAPRPRR